MNPLNGYTKPAAYAQKLVLVVGILEVSASNNTL